MRVANDCPGCGYRIPGPLKGSGICKYPIKQKGRILAMEKAMENKDSTFSYFVSYGWFSDDGNGLGRIEVKLKETIIGINKIREIEEYINSNYSGNRRNFSAIVLYWREFEIEDADSGK
jgi:hypothetical protein